MWLFSNNNDVRKKSVDKLVEVSTDNKLLVAKLKCWYDTNKKQGGKETSVYKLHFGTNGYMSETELCVNA